MFTAVWAISNFCYGSSCRSQCYDVWEFLPSTQNKISWKDQTRLYYST